MNKTQKFYDETAKDFHQRNKAKDLSCEYKEFEKHMGSGSRLLDLGCGPGRDAKYFSNEGFDVTGVDFSSAMLEIAKVEAPKANFKLFDIEHDNPKELGSFDGIWAMASLLHVPHENLEARLISFKNLLKNRTSPFFISLKVEDFRPRGDREFFYWKKEEAEKVFANVGFEVIYHSEHLSERSHFNNWILIA